MRGPWPTGGTVAPKTNKEKQNPGDGGQVFVRDVGNYQPTRRYLDTATDVKLYISRKHFDKIMRDNTQIIRSQTVECLGKWRSFEFGGTLAL